MSLLDDFEPVEYDDFPGGVSTLDASDAPAHRAGQEAENVHFPLGRVETRYGFAEAYDANLRIRSFYHWLQPDWSRLVYLVPDGASTKIRYRGLISGLENDVITGLGSSVYQADMIEFGSRLFIALSDSAGEGVAAAKVWNGLFTGLTPNVDDLFQAPFSSVTAVNSEPGSGVVTAGVHSLGYIIRTRNGYDTKAVEIGTFTATGGANLNVQLTPTGNWPDWADEVRLIMTTADNQERYYLIPNTVIGLPAGTSAAVNILVNPSDQEMTQFSVAADYFSLIQLTPSAGYGYPKKIIPYGNRMVYLADIFDSGSLGDVTGVFISDPSLPQWITADQHLVSLPKLREIVTGFVLHNQLYLCGPNWTYALVDNQDLPVTWAAAHAIDEEIGTPSMFGVSTNQAGTRAWVASQKGLYLFEGGNFPELPTSFYQDAEWNRINWSAKNRVVVVENQAMDCVHVLAPLDAETIPNRVFTWDYKRGIEFDTAKFSDWFSAAGFPAIGHLASVYQSDNPELWMSQDAVNGKFLRLQSPAAGDVDPTLHQDDGNRIASKYRTGPIPKLYETLHHFFAFFIYASGVGDVAMTAVGHNAVRAITLADAALTAAKKFFKRTPSMQDNAASLRIENGSDSADWFSVSRIKAYVKETLTDC